MAKVNFYKRYLFIIDRLQSVPSNFEEIRNYIQKRFESEDKIDNVVEYSIRTFDRDKADIRDLFGIYIQYDRKDKVYFINEEILDTSVGRMIEAFSIHQALKEKKVSPSIYLESRKAEGTNLMNGILHAIQNYHLLEFTHTKYWEMKITKRKVKPIAIKESQHRWYLIGEDNTDGIVKNFGFDRITDFKILDSKFKPITFNVEQKYQHAFGIETYEKAQKIVLQFSWQQGNYIKSFPLHSSQIITTETNEKLVVELFIQPTNDFIMELLKYGKEAKVLEPKTLQNEIKYRIKEMTQLYQ